MLPPKYLAPFLVLPFLLPDSIGGQDKKKEEKKIDPVVKVVLPLGAKLGATTKLTIRGLKLENAKEVKFADPAIKIKIVSKGQAPVPDKNPQQVGDTQVVVEVTLPAKLDKVSFTVLTAEGETQPHTLLVETQLPVLAEKEPNEGFRQAQEIALPTAIDGIIDRPKDVDVFRFHGKAKQKVSFEVQAARHGSPFDALLTLYDSAGQQLARHDDLKDSVDARLDFILPGEGQYYLVVMDAHDAGSSVHGYRLMGRVE